MNDPPTAWVSHYLMGPRESICSHRVDLQIRESHQPYIGKELLFHVKCDDAGHITDASF